MKQHKMDSPIEQEWGHQSMTLQKESLKVACTIIIFDGEGESKEASSSSSEYLNYSKESNS
jgi:hypothetical protein